MSTNAERQKRYRERKKEKLGLTYLEKDAQRKRESRKKYLKGTRNKEANKKKIQQHY